MSYPCPCCDCLTLNGCPPGTFEICSVCYWEDDASQSADPTYEGGANAISLEIARKNYRKIGASEAKHKSRVREPYDDEMP